MKSIPGALLTHYQSGDTTIATLWKVTRADGLVLGFTDHDRDLTVGAVTYLAASGFNRSAVETRANLGVDDLELEGALDSPAITEADLDAGLWDYAQVEIYRCNWKDLTQGLENVRRGWLGEVRAKDFSWVAELRGLMQPLQQQVIEISTPACRAALGDTRCKVRLDPPAWAATTAYSVRADGAAESGSVVKPTTFNGAHFYCSTAGTSGGSEPTWNTTPGATTNDGTAVWTAITALTHEGTVTSVTDQRSFADSALAPAAGFFEQGVVTWLTGANAGLAKEVKTHGASGAIVLVEPMPYIIAVSDTFTISAGCLKSDITDCKTRFNNLKNFRGEPHRPTFDTVIRGPN